MDALTIDVNEDGTLTFVPPIADPVLCAGELWTALEDNEHVVIDARPPVDETQPGLTYIGITCTNMWLQYQVKTETDAGRVLELRGYSEL